MSTNEIIAAYIAAKEAEKQAKKEKDRLQALILDAAGGADFFETDAYRIMIDTRARTSIDTEAVYKDFPEFKDVYGKTTEYTVLTVKAKAATKTA